MQSRSRVPEEPLGRPRPRAFVTGSGADDEPAAGALVCLGFYRDRWEASA